MRTTKTTVRMSGKTEVTFKSLYGRKTTPAQEAVDSFLSLRSSTLREIKEMFTINECMTIIICLEDIKIYAPFMVNNNVLANYILDTCDTERVHLRFHICVEDLIGKLRGLTSAQTYFLQSEAYRYWQYFHYEISLEQFAISLALYDD